jgi:hypothetical protein
MSNRPEYTLLVTGSGELWINAVQDFIMPTDMLFDLGSNIAWLQNLNLDFVWALVRTPSIPAGPAVQPSSTQGRITLYKIVGQAHKRNSTAWYRATPPPSGSDLLNLEQSSSPAGLTMLNNNVLNNNVLGQGPFAIITLQEYEASAASYPLSKDMLFDPGSNIAWLQNLNLDFMWALVHALSIPAGPAVQRRNTLYKIVGQARRRNSTARLRATPQHVEAWDQTVATMGEKHFHTHAGKYWSMRSCVFSSTGKLLMMELECWKMINHVIKMDRVPPSGSDLLNLEQSSSPAGLTTLNNDVLGQGPFAIVTLQEYEASTASYPLSEDMLLMMELKCQKTINRVIKMDRVPGDLVARLESRLGRP